MNPLISIVVKTHNRGELLFRALNCLINQTYSPIEILVLDHNSNDNTEEIAKSFGEEVTYYKHTGSYRDMYNVWRDKVRGEFVSFLDDDDYIESDCIEKLYHVLKERTEIDVVFSRYEYFIIENGKRMKESESPKIDCGKINQLLLLKCVVPLNAVLFRKECVQDIPKTGPEIRGSFDWYFWIQFAVAGYKFHQIDEVLGYIQRSPDSVQLEFERMSISKVQCIQYYGKRLGFFNKLHWGYFYILGYHLISFGINCLENGDRTKGHHLLIKGICLYFFSLKNRVKLLPAFLILFSSLISNYKLARFRIEKLFGNYIFRPYAERKDGRFKTNNPSSFWNV